MKLNKKLLKRLEKADFYQVFVIDDNGVGYASNSGKRGISGNAIITFINRLEKEKQYLIELVERESSIPGVS